MGCGERPDYGYDRGPDEFALGQIPAVYYKSGTAVSSRRVLTFTTPDFGASGKLIYAYLTYTLLMMLYTAVNVPYSALMGVITPNSLERTEVSTFRFVAAFCRTIYRGCICVVIGLVFRPRG
jgi:Na+/melibiose symporter-like transporter